MFSAFNQQGSDDQGEGAEERLKDVAQLYSLDTEIVSDPRSPRVETGFEKFLSLILSMLNLMLKRKCLVFSQAWWCTPVISELGRLRQEVHHEFETSLGYNSDSTASLNYIVRLSQKQTKKLGMMSRTCNPSIQEAAAVGSP